MMPREKGQMSRVGESSMSMRASTSNVGHAYLLHVHVFKEREKRDEKKKIS